MKSSQIEVDVVSNTDILTDNKSNNTSNNCNNNNVIITFASFFILVLRLFVAFTEFGKLFQIIAAIYRKYSFDRISSSRKFI